VCKFCWDLFSVTSQLPTFPSGILLLIEVLLFILLLVRPFNFIPFSPEKTWFNFNSCFYGCKMSACSGRLPIPTTVKIHWMGVKIFCLFDNRCNKLQINRPPNMPIWMLNVGDKRRL
jgi:hypothetical protein